jgi:hypothetical protein
MVAAASEEATTNVQSVASATEEPTSSVNEIILRRLRIFCPGRALIFIIWIFLQKPVLWGLRRRNDAVQTSLDCEPAVEC